MMPNQSLQQTTEGPFSFLPLMNLRKWLYRGGRPNWLASILNRLWAAVHALGIAPNYLVTLEAQGRRSGRRISLPLVMVTIEGARYTWHGDKLSFYEAGVSTQRFKGSKVQRFVFKGFSLTL